MAAVVELHSYDPQAFEQLPDFFESRDRLDILQNKVRALGEVICSHGLHQVFGVAMLHKHFDLSRDELLVRRYLSPASSVMQAECPEFTEQRLYPYLWQCRTGEGGEGFYPLEFAAYENRRDTRRFCAHMAHLSSKPDFLSSFRDKEEELGLNGMVALSGLRGEGVQRRPPPHASGAD